MKQTNKQKKFASRNGVIDSWEAKKQPVVGSQEVETNEKRTARKNGKQAQADVVVVREKVMPRLAF